MKRKPSRTSTKQPALCQIKCSTFLQVPCILLIRINLTHTAGPSHPSVTILRHYRKTRRATHTRKSTKLSHIVLQECVPPCSGSASHILLGSNASINIQSLSRLQISAATSRDDEKNHTSLKSTLLSRTLQEASVPYCAAFISDASVGSNANIDIQSLSRL